MEIVESPFVLEIYGLGGIAVGKDYVGTAFGLSGKVWQLVKSNNLKNKGLNVWVYEPGEVVFTGVELLEPLNEDVGLERKVISIRKYAYLKHVGPYNLIKVSGQTMRDELRKKGLETILPYIEIYGHWTSDESKLETELIMSLKQ